MKYLAYLKTPVPANDTEFVYRIVLDETENGTYVYLFCAPDAQSASYDEWYPDTETARGAWQAHTNERGWIPLDGSCPA